MNKILQDYVGESLHAARAVAGEEASTAVLAFIEDMEESYVGDMGIEGALMHLAQAIRDVA